MDEFRDDENLTYQNMPCFFLLMRVACTHIEWRSMAINDFEIKILPSAFVNKTVRKTATGF